MLVEVLKAVFIGIVEGITEWLPISSTGHMIIVDEFIQLDVSDEFLELFLVVIQIGAIMAVVTLYFTKLNPFSRRKTPSQRKGTWRLWGMVVVGCIPAAIVGLLFDDWVNEHFYNAVTVATMLIVYGVVFIVMERRNRKKVEALQAEKAGGNAASDDDAAESGDVARESMARAIGAVSGEADAGIAIDGFLADDLAVEVACEDEDRSESAPGAGYAAGESERDSAFVGLDAEDNADSESGGTAGDGSATVSSNVASNVSIPEVAVPVSSYLEETDIGSIRGGKHVKDPDTGKAVSSSLASVNEAVAASKASASNDDTAAFEPVAVRKQSRWKKGKHRKEDMSKKDAGPSDDMAANDVPEEELFEITDVDQIDAKMAFKIGLFQVLAIIPGTSRSGATIIGGMLSGASRSASTEFTFFLAIPVMLGWGLLKTAKFLLEGLVMTQTEIVVLIVGVLVAFVTSVLSIKFLMGYIKRNDFTAFGVYRIIVGVVLLVFFGATGQLMVMQ